MAITSGAITTDVTHQRSPLWRSSPQAPANACAQWSRNLNDAALTTGIAAVLQTLRHARAIVRHECLARMRV